MLCIESVGIHKTGKKHAGKVMKMLHVHLKFRKRRFKKFFSQLGYIQSYVPFVYLFGKLPFLYDALRIYIIM